MASIVTDPNGRRRISFKLDKKRKTLRLGLVSEQIAMDHKKSVEYILLGRHAPHLVPAETFKKVAAFDDDLYDRYAACGLVPPRVTDAAATIGGLIADVRAEIQYKKPNTRAFYETVFTDLEEHFLQHRPVAEIKTKQADAFVAWVRNDKKLSPATVSRRIKAYRLMFRRACRWGWTDANPFEGVRAGASVNHTRKQFIPLDWFEKLVAATPDREFRCVLALSRLAALRTPSEIQPLRWIDVHWDEGRLFIRSSKTEEHEGGDSRVMPLFPRLREILWEWYEHAPEGATYVIESINRGADKNFRTRLGKLIDRCGLKRWPKLFQNMRASRESELVAEYPLATVCKWLGHSPEVSALHYLMDPDKDQNFRAAAGLDEVEGEGAGGEATRNPTRASSEDGGSSGKGTGRAGSKTQQNTLKAGEDAVDNRARRDSNSDGKPNNPARQERPDAQSDARDPQLTELTQLWPSLPVQVRAELLRAARAAVASQ